MEMRNVFQTNYTNNCAFYSLPVPRLRKVHTFEASIGFESPTLTNLERTKRVKKRYTILLPDSVTTLAFRREPRANIVGILEKGAIVAERSK